MHKWINAVLTGEATLVSDRLFWFLYSQAHDPLDRSASERAVSGMVTIDTLKFEQKYSV